MKKYSFLAVATLFLTGFALQSCKKSMDYNQNVKSAAFVKVVHAAPQRGVLNFSFDADRVNLDFFNYTNHTSYIPLTTGNNVFKVYDRGSSIALITKNIVVSGGKNYSLFIVDTALKMDAVLLRDSTRGPGPDSVRLRFANMSPDAENLDLYIAGHTTPVATNVPYKNAGDFLSLKAANNVTFEVRQAGQSNVLATSASINLLTGNFYTIWSTGFRSLATDVGKVRVEAIRH